MSELHLFSFAHCNIYKFYSERQRNLLELYNELKIKPKHFNGIDHTWNLTYYDDDPHRAKVTSIVNVYVPSASSNIWFKKTYEDYYRKVFLYNNYYISYRKCNQTWDYGKLSKSANKKYISEVLHNTINYIDGLHVYKSCLLLVYVDVIVGDIIKIIMTDSIQELNGIKFYYYNHKN